MSARERFVLVPADELAELVKSAVADALTAGPPAYLDKHTASILGLSPAAFVKACREGKFPREMRGRKYVARRSDVENYLSGTRIAVETAPTSLATVALDPIEKALQSGRLKIVP